MAKHLIHIGYPKAGSTFVQEWFKQHPKMCYAPGGLGGYYNIYEVCRPKETMYEYFVTSFEGISTPHKDAGGVRIDPEWDQQTRPTTIRRDQKQVCEVLRTLYPGSSILIITRGFKGIISSGYSQYVRTGGTLHLAEMRTPPDAYQHYDFDYLIRLYSEAFGPENLIVLPYELLRDNQSLFLAVLEEKLNLEHIESSFGRLNPSLSPEELYWYPLISRRVAGWARRLGEARFRRVFTWYVGKTMENKLRRVIGVLRRLKPHRKITDADVPVELLDSCRGRATLLENSPLYAPYAAEYLWDLSEPRAVATGSNHSTPSQLECLDHLTPNRLECLDSVATARGSDKD